MIAQIRKPAVVICSGIVLLFAHPAWAQQIEPLAGTWKTWVLTSGTQLRLPPPPTALSVNEIFQLRALEPQRSAAAIDLVNYWDAGHPGFDGSRCFIPSGRAPLTRGPLRW